MSMSSPQLVCIVQSVKQYCLKQPKLRKQAALLARDIAAVCLQLRAAVMVDYMPLRALDMLAILAAAESQATALEKLTWPQLALLQLDNCIYLLCQKTLQSRLQQMSSNDTNTAYIAVSNMYGSPCLAMASNDDVKEVTLQLQTMCRLVLTASVASNSSTSCTFTDLSSVSAIPIMPTLSGWLLQYPVVYLADQGTAVLMAQLLSEAVLTLYKVQITGTFVKDLKQLSASQDEVASLYAFTVPESLYHHCRAAVSCWKAALANQWRLTTTLDAFLDHTIVSCRLAPHTVQI